MASKKDNEKIAKLFEIYKGVNAIYVDDKGKCSFTMKMGFKKYTRSEHEKNLNLQKL